MAERDTTQDARGYAHPEMLVSTQWVADHLDDPNVRLVESDEDVMLYEIGHIRGAVNLDWHTDLQDQIDRDFIDKAEFERLVGQSGIGNDTTVVFYGDRNNWYATYALWLFRYYGHRDVRIMDGGRAKWEAEGRGWTRDKTAHAAVTYTAQDADPSIRAFREDVMAQVEAGNPALIDVRSPEEYTGELLHAVGYPQEGAQRAGHIRGATSIPWAKAANDDGTFRPVEELRSLYGDAGITPDREVIAYCRIGERSSHTWFVLHELLGEGDVKNYDGSWAEYGSLVGVPIQKDV